LFQQSKNIIPLIQNLPLDILVNESDLGNSTWISIATDSFEHFTVNCNKANIKKELNHSISEETENELKILLEKCGFFDDDGKLWLCG